MNASRACFKAYSIHGCVPDVPNAPLAHVLGQTVTEVQGTNDVVLGHDPLASGLRQAGANVTDIGLCGTEEIYYAAVYHAANQSARESFDAGIMTIGSHNRLTKIASS